ncbi:solute carrier family 2, facilitated glucose transporter member 11-like isoform X2 [Rhinatrema bivittatum]|uniref:solute carrier family 2, facilitated glucose transporter member 11-like isoform X2 n=1 Tax=Rhinatrema bivittatum TaxID=194408 RepID=UPI00112BEE75|nr:solute carrier family 2, facilitated glucose transporter member 11-like isoform X2 [Rhinatrema bivittatum]
MVQYRVLFQLIFVLGIGGAFQHGFQISAINSASPFIKLFINQTWQNRYSTPIDGETLTLLWSSLVSVYSIGGLLGSLAAGHLIALYGKKNCQLWNSLIPVGAALLTGLSKVAGSFEMILAGRFFYGVNAGLGFSVHALYLGEVAPKKLRGFTNSTGPIFSIMGKLLGQIVGLREMLGTECLWPFLLALSGVTSLVQLLLLPFFPETPSYLLMQKGNLEDCRKAMKQLWGEGDHQSEIDDMMREQAARSKTTILTPLELLREKSLRWQLYILVVLVSSMQLSGFNAIYFYSYDIFQAAGFSLDDIPYLTLGAGICEAISIMLCSLLVERYGRKLLLLTGYGLMAFVLGLLTVTLSLQVWSHWMPYASIALVFLFIIFFATGPLGATAVISIEIFNQFSRAAAFVIFGSLNWVGLYLITLAFPFVVTILGHFCFLVFLGCIVIGWIFIYFFLMETRGKSIAEIMEEFNKLNFRTKGMQASKEIQEHPVCTRL